MIRFGDLYMKNSFKVLGLSFLLIYSAVTAGEWHPVYQEGASNSINAVASRPYDFRMQIAVGEQGNIYRSFDGGRYWEFKNAGIGEHLNDIVSFFDGSNDIFLAVGENGTIVRSDNFGDFWTFTEISDSGGTTEHFLSVAYDESNAMVYVAGENGAFYTSFDYGINWNYVPLENANLTVTDMVWDFDGLFVLGVNFLNVSLLSLRPFKIKSFLFTFN